MLKIAPRLSLVLSLILLFFPIKANASINATSYGVKCNGTTDDTVALQNAVNAAAGQTLLLPHGICQISKSIVFGATSYTVQGQGGGPDPSQASTTLRWAGDAQSPMIRLTGTARSLFWGFLIYTSSSFPLAVGIQSEAGPTGRTGVNTFQDLFMNGTTTALGKGFAFVFAPGGIDAGNDTSNFINVQIYNFATAAWSFEHSQSKGHQFFGCRYEGLGPTSSNYGITTALNGRTGGSFAWNGGGGGNVGVDFYLGQNNDTILISSGNFEGSGRLLATSGGTYVPWPVTIQGVRWAANNLNSDGIAIQYTFWNGPLNMIGNFIGDGSSLKKPLQIQVASDGGQYPQNGIAIGNNVLSSLAQPFTSSSSPQGAWRLYGNTVSTSKYGIALADSTGALYEASPADPVGNSLATAKMAGLAGSITPQRSGVVEYKVEGLMASSTGTGGCAVQISDGKGTAPSNGAAVTGTQLGRRLTVPAMGANAVPFSVHAIASGANVLPVGTTYWFDVTVAAVTGGTCTISGLNISAREL